MKKAQHHWRRVLAAGLAVGTIFVSGCRLLFLGAVVGGTVGVVAYANGALDDTLGNRYDVVVAATEKAIAQLGFAQPEERKDGLSDTLTTHNAKGDRVEIELTNVSDTATKVSIRVGVFGDEEMSMAILDKIKSNL